MLYLATRATTATRKCRSRTQQRLTERPEFNNGRGGGSGTYPGNSNWFQGNSNQGSFQVWGARKGDMARAVMYMAIRYEGGQHPTTGQSEPDLELTDNRSLIVNTSSLNAPAYMGLLSTLVEWHLADPPDDAERARNEVVFAYQGNRNPFIDHPEWAPGASPRPRRPPANSAPRRRAPRACGIRRRCRVRRRRPSPRKAR